MELWDYCERYQRVFSVCMSGEHGSLHGLPPGSKSLSQGKKANWGTITRRHTLHSPTSQVSPFAPLPISLSPHAFFSVALSVSLLLFHLGWSRFTVISADNDGLDSSINLLDAETKELTAVGEVCHAGNV